MFKRIVSVALVAAVLVVGVFAEGQQEAAGSVKLTFSSVSVPDDAHTKAMTVFKDEVEKLSGGQITVDVYHSGQLFNQTAEQDAIRQGTVDMVYTSAQWNAQFIPKLSMFGAAFTFQSYDQMTKTFNGSIGKKLFDEIAASQGIRPLTAYYLGTRQLNLIEKVGAVTKPEQMKGVKLRVPNSPTWIAMGKALGGDPTPMAFGEVYMGLKTGAVDGQDNPLPTDKNAKFYEVTKYIVLTNHVVDSTWPTINEKKWQSLSKQQQEWVLAAAAKGREFCDKTVLENEASLIAFFKEQGLTVIENPDRAAFSAYAKNSYLTESKDLSKDWDLALYDEVQKIK
ncbi:MAG: C4-dicarboxylate ABC transporter substrate-binding protein [Treponema sp. GWB1_62_6]|nr:MAG: C4-dicarboxylate ABC transporter substrate-binding protein [Treponema sp. GWC1_61_84]OHE68791.1 MAG: C4-dicarboxylate ABC transporter substrate-binding protein [Treponema sp. GWB1_62_6]OHE75057.1 MAG: C4-dicarboxylate ABC transporter substrate-binding protein [Treponema sp. RIFOXYC1_FULL_61_9]HCM28919.1 C4-dicarboxylate ABC transporter substrate-binding protein [Treponema sp.]